MITVDVDRTRRALRLVEQLLSVKPSERERILEKECPDPDVRRETLRLLRLRNEIPPDFAAASDEFRPGDDLFGNDPLGDRDDAEPPDTA